MQKMRDGEEMARRVASLEIASLEVLMTIHCNVQLETHCLMIQVKKISLKTLLKVQIQLEGQFELHSQFHLYSDSLTKIDL